MTGIVAELKVQKEDQALLLYIKCENYVFFISNFYIKEDSYFNNK